jgi:hypothetical protein
MRNTNGASFKVQDIAIAGIIAIFVTLFIWLLLTYTQTINTIWYLLSLIDLIVGILWEYTDYTLESTRVLSKRIYYAFIWLFLALVFVMCGITNVGHSINESNQKNVFMYTLVFLVLCSFLTICILLIKKIWSKQNHS